MTDRENKRNVSENEIESTDYNDKTLHAQCSTLHPFDGEWMVFLPDREIRAFENIYNKIAEAKQEFVTMMAGD
jgi:hypothetical protein